MTNSTNTNATKMTIAQKYDALVKYFEKIEVIDNLEFDVIEFLEDRKVKSIKKSTSKADEKKLAERATIEDAILEILANSKMRNSDLTKAINSKLETEYQPQKISNIVSSMVKEGTVTRTEEKKVAFFSC